MRALALLALLPLAAAGQSSAAVLSQGVLLERDAPALEGQFSIRAEDNQVYRYRFDTKTYVVADGRLTSVAVLTPGERVEVISDSVEGSVLRYARDIHVVADAPPVPRARPVGTLGSYGLGSTTLGSSGLGSASRSLSTFDPLSRYYPSMPVGDLTFAGVVYRVTGEHVVLHTRLGDQTILLRRDTRYIRDGEQVDSALLKPNMRVFVRGGKDLWDQVEAYQVFWGEILQPR